MEGSKPYIVEALVRGVITAKQEVRAAGLSIPIGFGSVPDGPAALTGFWSDLARSVERILRDLRDRNLVAAGIPRAVPIRITENGWPTGINPLDHSVRTYEAQVEVLDAVHRLRLELNVTHDDLFGLRDADSSNDELFHQFGILRDDYTPRPAFHAFRDLVDELGTPEAAARA